MQERSLAKIFSERIPSGLWRAWEGAETRPSSTTSRKGLPDRVGEPRAQGVNSGTLLWSAAADICKPSSNRAEALQVYGDTSSSVEGTVCKAEIPEGAVRHRSAAEEARTGEVVFRRDWAAACKQRP